MRSRPTLLLLSFALLACSGQSSVDLGDGHHDQGDAIIGGTVDTGDPSVVLMVAQDGNTGWWCTGTVIDKRVILTAAHCVEDATSSTTFRVLFGNDISKAAAGDWVPVKEWHHDPGYLQHNNIAEGHDAAVLILSADARAPAIGINRAALTKADVGAAVHVVGFGNDNGQQGTGAGIKRHIFTTIADLEQGVVDVGKSGQTTCQGDSGGPTFQKRNGVDVVIGITSYGESGCVSYGSSTRVDLSASWIDQYLTGGGTGGGTGAGGTGAGGGTGGTTGTGGSSAGGTSAGAGGSGGSSGGVAGSGGAPVCTPQCNGRTCGDDGCGHVCGTCPGGATCQAGQCVTPPSPMGCGTDVEPNDAPGQAVALCVGSVTGKISQPWDHDSWKFDLPAKSKVSLQLTTAHDYYFTLYRMSGKTAIQVGSYGGGAHLSLMAGSYVVEVWGGNGDSSGKDSYTLTLAR